MSEEKKNSVHKHLGGWVLSNGLWFRPGVFASKQTAILAADLSDEVLERLRDIAGPIGAIDINMVQAAFEDLEYRKKNPLPRWIPEHVTIGIDSGSKDHTAVCLVEYKHDGCRTININIDGGMLDKEQTRELIQRINTHYGLGCDRDKAKATQYYDPSTAPVPPAGHPLQKLGEYLAAMLDEDQWATAEQYLFAAWSAHLAPAAPDELRAFADEVKKLCKDFSDRQDRPYMGDVTAAIDGLYEQFTADPASPAATGWLPIETAPKDNAERILLCKDCGPGSLQSYSVGFFIKGWHGAECRGMQTLDDIGYRVTHWMPLPDYPPAPSVDGEG